MSPVRRQCHDISRAFIRLLAACLGSEHKALKRRFQKLEEELLAFKTLIADHEVMTAELADVTKRTEESEKRGRGDKRRIYKLEGEVAEAKADKVTRRATEEDLTTRLISLEQRPSVRGLDGQENRDAPQGYGGSFKSWQLSPTKFVDAPAQQQFRGNPMQITHSPPAVQPVQCASAPGSVYDSQGRHLFY